VRISSSGTRQRLLHVVLLCLQGFNIPSEGMWFWFEGMVDLFFYIDLVLNFFTAHEVSSGSCRDSGSSSTCRLVVSGVCGYQGQLLVLTHDVQPAAAAAAA
jgi:hypothetical protein